MPKISPFSMEKLMFLAASTVPFFVAALVCQPMTALADAAPDGMTDASQTAAAQGGACQKKRLLLTAKKGPTPWTILWLCWILAVRPHTS